MFVCEVEEGSKLAIELHPELSIVRHEPDLLDELTDTLGGLEAGVLVIEGFGEVGDLLAIEFGKFGCKRGMGGGAAASRARSSTRLASRTAISSFTAAPGTPALMASMTLRMSRSVFSSSRAVRSRPHLVRPLPIHLPVELIDERRDQFWVHQLVLKPIQDRGFELVSSHGQ